MFLKLVNMTMKFTITNIGTHSCCSTCFLITTVDICNNDIKAKYSHYDFVCTQATYGRRMHNLLYLEEYQQRKDFSRYVFTFYKTIIW